MFHRHRVCLADRVDLIGSLYGWWEGFGSSSSATLPLGFNCGFISTSECGSSTGVCSWGCPGGLGSASGRARCGGGAAAWVTGVLAASGTRGRWRPGQQEIWCSRRVQQPVLANTLQCSCLENATPHPRPNSLTEKSGRPQSAESQKVRAWRKRPCTHRHLFLPVAALPQWELSMKVAQLLGLRGPGSAKCEGTQTPPTAGDSCQSLFLSLLWPAIRGLFGQSFSVAPPAQALRGLPCLESSVAQHIRHTEGPPGWGPAL